MNAVVAGAGRYKGVLAVSYTCFVDAYTCCWRDKQTQRIVDLHGRALTHERRSAIPFYPTGINITARSPDVEQVYGTAFSGKRLDSRVFLTNWR